MTEEKSSHYIVQCAASMPQRSCWGRYRRVGVLEVPAGVQSVGMISERDPEVIQVVETWEKLNVGSTERCAYQRALTEAHALAARLNRERGDQ